MSNDLIPFDADQPNVLHALTRKRAEIAGKIEHTQLELRHLIAELDHIDAAIRIFNPAIDIGAIRSKPVPPRHVAFKGEVTRVVLRALREAKEPLTSRDIALRLMKERGLNPDDRELSVIMVKRVCACLRVQKKKGFVRNAPTAELPHPARSARRLQSALRQAPPGLRGRIVLARGSSPRQQRRAVHGAGQISGQPAEVL